MIGYYKEQQRLSAKIYAAVMASGALLAATGCANMATTAATGPSAGAKPATLSGRVHGGNQPVAFATVYLYVAGETGYGSPATLLATTTTANDGYGSFTFNQAASGTYPSSGNTFACSESNDNPPLLYVRAVGGNTQGTGDSGTTNSAATFLAPLGPCASISNSTFVDLTEVTTAASVAALAQYINPSTEDVGTAGILLADIALQNSMALVNNLVNQANGTANATVTLTGSGVSGVTVTATPESAKLNTIANILSSCINEPASSGSNCSALFAGAVPPTSGATSQPGTTDPAATDTLQAALYMNLNPTDSNTTNLTNLYNLQPAIGAPYQPTLTSAPTDWTMGIAYTASGTCASSTAPFFANPYDIDIAFDGSVWLVNLGSSANGTSLVQVTPNGTPATCVPFSGTSMAGGVVDINGNIWYTDTTSNVYRYKPSDASTLDYTASSGGWLGGPLGIAADGSGNVFFSTSTGGGNAVGYVYEISNGANAVTTNSPDLVSNYVGPMPYRLFPDTAGDIWVTSGTGYVTQLQTATSGSHFINGYNSIQFPVPNPSYGIIVGPANGVYISSQDPAASLTVLDPGNGTYAPRAGFPTNPNAGGLSNPAGIWLDGSAESWIGNNAAETATGLDAISVITKTGTAVSPTGTPNGNSNGGYQKSASYFNGLRGVTIDPGGNVWTTSDGVANGITELVGAAIPIVNPYSYGLQNVGQGRFQTIP